MEIKNKRIILLVAAALLSVITLSAQNNSGQKDSLVRLVKASSLELIQKDGLDYRKAVDATFLHNGTYLICDTALWNVDEKTISAFGNVQLMQDETVLTSETLTYYMDDNLARFRGGVVQLADKQNNTLRTHNLDYNTKDSLAIFFGGAAFRDKDGQIIESRDGKYSSAAKIFNFIQDVNMFTDSIFVKTELLDYDASESKAVFKSSIDFWKDDSMLSSDSGWYDRNSETFFFNSRVHGITPDQEMWSDSLFFYRETENIVLRRNAQLRDTTRNVYALSDFIRYSDSEGTVDMRGNASIAIRSGEEQGQIDTLYMGAGELFYKTVEGNRIDSLEIKEAFSRREDMSVDAVKEYRERVAIEAAEAAKKAMLENGGMLTRGIGKVDLGAEQMKIDTLGKKDKLKKPEPPVLNDSTKIAFIRGKRNVKLFRKDLQAVCDSLLYSDLDSIARMYINPVVWSDTVRQFTSDSIFLQLKNGSPEKASLLSNAFVTVEEKENCFDQIKAIEISAYFDSTAALRRFDALGGVQAIFFLEENGAMATANLVKSKIMSGVLKNGELDRVYYFDNPDNNAYPTAQLSEQQKRMKGFQWMPHLRPQRKEDVTSISLRPSERLSYERHPRTSFPYTERYFPGYMKEVYESIAHADSVNRARQIQEKNSKKSGKQVSDTLSALSDTLSAVRDTSVLGVGLDTTAVGKAAPADSISMVKDGKTRREEHWAARDARDAAKKAAREKKRLERRRAKTLKALIARQKQEIRDAGKLARYEKRFERQKARRAARRRKV